MNGILSSDYTKITLKNDYISQVFNSNDISQVEVVGQRNCCSTSYTNTVDFELPEEPCEYKGFYYYNTANGDNETWIRTFTMNVRGNIVNIVPLDQNVFFNGVIDIEDVVNDWLTDNGYSDATFTVTAYPNDAGLPTALAYELGFTGLPSGVFPVQLDAVAYPDGDCFITVPFICQNLDNCSKLTATYTMATGKDVYTIASFTVLNYTTGLVETVELVDLSGTYTGPSFTYNTAAPVIPYSSIDNVVEQFIAAGVGGGDNPVTLDLMTVNTTTHDIIFEFSDNNDDYRVIGVSIYKGATPGSQDREFSQSYCTEEIDPTVDCEYSVEFDTTDISGIMSILMNNDVFLPYPIIANSYTLAQLASLETEVENWLTNNGGSAQDFDTVSANDRLTFTFTEMAEENVPFSVSVINSDLTQNTYYFQCTQLLSVPNPDQYDPTKIEYSYGDIIVYPEFFGQTDTFEDGIYSLQLEVTLLNGDKYVEEVCIFSDKDIKCKVADAMYLNPKGMYYQLFESIKFAESCNDCDCQQMCDIYKELLTQLNNAEPDDLCRCTSC